MRIGVIGAGAWGTALACHAARLGHEVVIWALEPGVADDINRNHVNATYLADSPLPESLTASADVEAVVRDAPVLILVAPSEHLRRVSTEVARFMRPDALVVCATKGIEQGSLKLMSGVLEETMPALSQDRLGILSGPSFAKEVAAQQPAHLALASTSSETAQRLQDLLHSPVLRIYTSEDPIGVQVGGAIKNVAAVATGASDGLGLGLSARSGLITRALAEMTRLGVALGANPLTFLGMAGVGDLVLTCSGDLSRNRTLGKAVAEGADVTEYLASRKSVAEGFSTCAAAWELSQKLDVDMPITEQVFHVLHEGRPLADAVQNLLDRDPKQELHGIR